MHNGRVEVIPASAMEFITYVMWAPQPTSYVMYDEDEKALAYGALSLFTIKYDPAKDNEVTDYFSSSQIQKIVFNHTGVLIDLTELHKLMIEMKYNYELQQDEFVWKCCKL